MYLAETINRILTKVGYFGYDSAHQAAYHLLKDKNWRELYDLTELRPWEVRMLERFATPQKPPRNLRVKAAPSSGVELIKYLDVVGIHQMSVARVMGWDILAYIPHYNLSVQHVHNHIYIAGIVKAKPFTKEQMN